MYSLACKMILLCIFAFLFHSTSTAPQADVRPFFKQENIAGPYHYRYNVSNPATGTRFGKEERGDGAGTVTGFYYVYLPDGRVMVVDYTAHNKTGFMPRIRYYNAGTFNPAFIY